jgi:putative oxidoreductase
VSRLFAWKGHSYIGLTARVYLALVFLFACVHKIISPEDFAVDIATYQILPTVLVNPMAIMLPFIEAAAGALLLIGLYTRGAALLICGMMAVFTAAVSIALADGLDMSCGCFASKGAAEDPISWKTIVRDTSWLALSIYVLVFDDGRLGLDGLLKKRRAKKSKVSTKEMQP